MTDITDISDRIAERNEGQGGGQDTGPAQAPEPNKKVRVTNIYSGEVRTIANVAYVQPATSIILIASEQGTHIIPLDEHEFFIENMD